MLQGVTCLGPRHERVYVGAYHLDFLELRTLTMSHWPYSVVRSCPSAVKSLFSKAFSP